jgi:hypothetical protein
MNFGQKLPKDNQTLFKKSSGNNRTFGKKLQNIRHEPNKINNEQLYRNALFPENIKELPRHPQLER